jgi:hypothetical protein
MSLPRNTRVLLGVFLLATLVLNTAPVRAAATDYRFEVVQVRAAGAGKSNVTLRLVHTPDKKPVTDAVLFQLTADMGPDGMPTMTAPAKLLPASSAGLYIVEIQPGMTGNWALQVAAKVQGETETVRTALPVKLEK